MGQTKRLLFFLVLTVIMQSCSSTKDVFPEGVLLEVKKMAVQKIVPGMPQSPPFYQLFVQVEYNDSDLNLDSVYYQSKVYFFESTSDKELRLEESKPCSDTMYVVDAESAAIFYHVGSKNYYQIHEVIKLESIYMP